ncbi:hypothetical protein PMAYCL1PPCAC_11701, partial [Pristionchus mayeri]
PVTGLHANFSLLCELNEAVGKEVVLELVDGSVFTGIFACASDQMDVGLYNACNVFAESDED